MALEQPKKVTGGAFGRYMAEHRAALLKELPGKPAVEALKLGSARFKALSPSEVAKYQIQYEQAKQLYEKDLQAFKAAGGEMKAIKRKGEKRAKKTKDQNKPKKPAGGAYGCYLAKHRAAMIKECEGKPITAVSKLAGERWKCLSDAEKRPFEQEYQKKKAAYEAAMKDYVPPAGANNEKEEEDDEEKEEEEEGEEEDENEEEEEDAEAQPPAKKAKTATGDEVAEAKSLGYARQFATLSENKQIKASPTKILGALKASRGKTVDAKRALLAGA